MEYTIGSTVFGSWTITKEIGEGGFGKVYEVRNNKGNIETASALKVIRIPRSVSDVKYIRSQGMDDQSVTEYFHGFVDRLVKEIATMSQLKDHPNIVRYEDHQVIPREGEFGWDILIRMELLTPFPDYYMEHGLSPEEVCRLGKEMCGALVFCHKNGIIHRDVKPSNIFVNSLEAFKLGDFGVSRTMGKSTGTARQGTESYMAPEVYLGRHYGANVDIYSLGIMLYQLMNGGRLPFFPPAGQLVGYGDEDTALKRRIDGEPFPPPANASPELAAVILKACAYDPNARYPDGQALLEDLNRLDFSAKPLVTPKRETVSFMNMAKGVEEAGAPARNNSADPDKTVAGLPIPELSATETLASPRSGEDAAAAPQDSRMAALWQDAFAKAADLALGADAPDYTSLTGSQVYAQLEALCGGREGFQLEKNKWNSMDIFLDSGPYTFYIVYSELSEIQFFSSSWDSDWDSDGGEGQWGPLSRFAVMPKGVNLLDPWDKVYQALGITREMADWLSGRPAAWEDNGAGYTFSLAPPEAAKGPEGDSVRLAMGRKTQGGRLELEFTFDKNGRRLTVFSATAEGLRNAYPNGFSRADGSPPPPIAINRQTKSPFDRLGGKPTGWQASPLSGEQKGQEKPGDGTTPIAKASIPPHDPDKTEPGRAAMNVKNPGVGGWKQAADPQKKLKNWTMAETDQYGRKLKSANDKVMAETDEYGRRVEHSEADRVAEKLEKSRKTQMIIGISGVLVLALLLIILGSLDKGNRDSRQASSSSSSSPVQSSAPTSRAESSAPADTGYTMVRKVEILNAPQADGQVIATASPGEILEAAGGDAPQGQWTEVAYNGQTGYVQTPLLTINDVGICQYSSTELCDRDGNILTTVDKDTALIVLGYTARDYGYWYEVSYEGETYYVDGSQLTLSEALFSDRVKEVTVRLPLSRTAAQPGDSWLNLETLEPGQTLRVYQSFLPSWYIIPVNDSTDFYYVEAAYFQEYFDSLLTEKPEDKRVWDQAVNISNMVNVIQWGAPVSEEDAAMLAKWELVQKNLTQNLQLGPDAPDYLTLSQNEFDSFIAGQEDAAYFFPTDKFENCYYYRQGTEDPANWPFGISDSLSFTRIDDNTIFTCGAIYRESDTDLFKELQEIDRINFLSLRPRGTSLGIDTRKSLLSRLGITQEMLDWAVSYGDYVRYSWYNVSESCEKRENYSLFVSGNHLSIDGGILPGDFQLDFATQDDDNGYLISFKAYIAKTDLVCPDGFERAQKLE